ncbi:CPBP family intramembrane glutamic endopeptidase [Halocatena halophila]|uniref:CPBP family intramembrane glutamic endopeptidase n=1 Tax=Halocatena halophila TaxID=2814576 RepID=UPI002ED26030
MIEADEPYWRFRTVLRAIAVGVSALFVGLVVMIVLQSLLAGLGVAITGHPGRVALLSSVSLQGVAFIGTSLAYLSLLDRFSLLNLQRPSWRTIKEILAGFLLVVLAWVAISYLLEHILQIPTAESSFIQDVQQQPVLIWLFLGFQLIVGPSEELLFRGVVQGSMRRAMGPVSAIVLASLFFASIHYTSMNGSVVSVVGALSVVFVLSLTLGALYELTENLIVPAVVHGLFNATQFLLAYLQATGQL